MAKFTHDFLAKFRTCPKCGVGVEDLVIGGIGDWRTRIICMKCLKVQKGLPYEEVIVPLAAQKHGISEQGLRRADAMSQEEHERVILEGPLYEDLPGVPDQARWLARRLLESST